MLSKYRYYINPCKDTFFNYILNDNNAIFKKYIRKGAYGDIYLIENSDKQYAIKYSTKSLFNEYSIQNSLNCKNIVKINKYYNLNDHYAIIYPYYKYGDLFDYIINNNIKKNNAKKIFKSIIKSIYTCHYNNIVHGDLKPENFLIDNYLNIYLTDFGSSFRNLTDSLDTTNIGNMKSTLEDVQTMSLKALISAEQFT